MVYGALAEISGMNGTGKTEYVLRKLAHIKEHRIAWIEDKLTIYPSAFPGYGVALDRVLFVETGKDVVWASLQEFLALPVKQLASRFGEHGVELGLRARGEIPILWPAYRPLEKIVEKQELFDPDGSSPCATARLRGRSLRALCLGIELELERAAMRSWKIQLPLAQGSTAGIMPILRQRLDCDLTRTPLSAPLTEVRLSILETAPGRAAMVSAVITYRSRSAKREVKKVLGLDPADDPRDAETAAKVEKLADEIYGFPRHLSIHSGGFTLSREPLIETVPIEPARMEKRTIVQWDKDDLDAIGLLKVDILALGMLSAIRRACNATGLTLAFVGKTSAENFL